MTIHPAAATGSTQPPPTAPATVVPLLPHPSPARRLAATRIRSTGGMAGDGRSELAEAATGLWQACRAMPTAAITAVLLLAEGLLLAPLWAALRCAIAAWHRLRRPTGPTPTPTPYAPVLLGAAPPSADSGQPTGSVTGPTSCQSENSL